VQLPSGIVAPPGSTICACVPAGNISVACRTPSASAIMLPRATATPPAAARSIEVTSLS